ncbi:hypothetical protein FRC03_002222 [Tulasnella sp. 419]|nr:hypothetical protein FRC03_002222 [Tulasnella sp. 419]
MFQTSDIPVFQGSQSPQDSKEWLETLVACTGSFSDSGIFRLITTKLPPGSVARKWYDSLEGSVKKSWEDFEKKFRDRWIDENQRLVDQRAAWAAFTLHTLSEDAIFSGIALRSDDAGGIISSWVEEHIPLGMATTLDDATLIKATHVRLPPFIAAYMQLNHPSSSISFPDYCRSIAQIPSTNLHLEKIRRQISSKDQISKIEKKVEEIAEQLRRLTEATKPGELQALGEIRSQALMMMKMWFMTQIPRFQAVKASHGSLVHP